MSKAKTHQGAGPSQRQLRVAELIRRTLAEVLARDETHDPDLARVPITVSEVRVSPDLKIATAFIMPLGGQDRDVVLKALARNRAELRHLISRGLTLKYAPDLRFRLDETFDRMDDTRRLLSEDRVRRDIAAPSAHSGQDDDPGAR